MLESIFDENEESKASLEAFEEHARWQPSNLVCRLAQDFGKGVKPAFNSTTDLSMPLPVL